MQYKNILVYLDDGDSNQERINTAAAIAKQHHAQLTGVVVSALPSQGMLAKLGIAYSEQALEAIRQSASDIADDFEHHMLNAGLHQEIHILECRESDAPAVLARMVRNYDLCILRQSNPDQANPNKANVGFIDDVCEQVLFYSGRPVLFVPYIGSHSIPCQVGLIAWDGSAAASRAVHDALPLLSDMQEVVILVVDPESVQQNADSKPGEELSNHLTAHGVNNTVKRVSSGGLGASSIILNEVSDTGADMLIMGGYGTPKLREMLLGGATRSLFKAMTVPVLMSH